MFHKYNSEPGLASQARESMSSDTWQWLAKQDTQSSCHLLATSGWVHTSKLAHSQATAPDHDEADDDPVD